MKCIGLKFVILVFLCTACIILFAKNREMVTELENQKPALAECIEDLQGKCGNCISYAILLERENARLNKEKKTCGK